MTRLGTTLADTPALALSNARRSSRVADYVELIKPRIVALELVTVAVAAHVASPWGIEPLLLLHTLLGAALVAASAGAVNQWLEHASDAKMERTANRPLPSGRMARPEVLTFGVVTLLLGCAELAAFVNPTTAGMAMATWLVYVVLYTPLKSVSPLNTAVGAVSGALPILLGWTASGAEVDLRALAMMGVLFLWQFPHFMAIAWLCRDDYARAGQKMLTVVDPTGLRAGAQAVAAALALIPVSLILVIVPSMGSLAVYLLWTFVLGVGQLVIAVRFLTHRSDETARQLLRASLVYLPCWMGIIVMVS